jgi:hypothetical protein
MGLSSIIRRLSLSFSPSILMLDMEISRTKGKGAQWGETVTSEFNRIQTKGKVKKLCRQREDDQGKRRVKTDMPSQQSEQPLIRYKLREGREIYISIFPKGSYKMTEAEGFYPK